MRQPGETVAEYVAELQKLSEHCDFKDTLEDMLRDRLVWGIVDPRIQHRLLAENKLTFTKAQELYSPGHGTSHKRHQGDTRRSYITVHAYSQGAGSGGLAKHAVQTMKDGLKNWSVAHWR